MTRERMAGAHLDGLTLQAFVDHEASPAETLRCARHLSHCAGCEAARAQLGALADGLSSLPGVEVPDGFSRRVMERVATQPAPRRRARLLRLVPPAAAAVLVSLAALAAPWTARLARGAGRLLPDAPWGPGELMDVLMTLGAAVLAGLARATANLGPWFTGPEVGPAGGFHLPGTVLLLGLGAAAGLLGLALAGGGLWIARARKAR